MGPERIEYWITIDNNPVIYLVLFGNNKNKISNQETQPEPTPDLLAQTQVYSR